MPMAQGRGCTSNSLSLAESPDVAESIDESNPMMFVPAP
jgi:hypothetical protein